MPRGRINMDSIHVHPDVLAGAIERWQNNVIDTDLAVDAARADVERALAALRTAVRERQRAIDHLTHLIGCARLEAA
jgi:hypothetical protein